MNNNRYRVAPRLAWRVIDEKAYVFDPAASELHELSDTATIAWLGLDKCDGIEAIAGKIANEFEVSKETALSDTNALLKDFQRKGLVEING